ncbi:MAG: hypothetical protein IJM05_06925 [Bacteroidales bacterium]|nr:hypothetical protein [Bacteroidales bacterium]
MKRPVCIAVLICSTLISVFAQNNPYSIDDTCYEYYKMADKLVVDTNTDAFEIANNALLKRAQEVGDEKARTIFYVEKLKRVIRFARIEEDHQIGNEMVEKQRRETQQVSRETGFLQYFYYAQTLVQTYYINTRQEIHAMALLREMMDIAAREQNEYGLWQSNIYVAILYQRQNDIINARKHTRNAIDIYDNSSDPTIRRQSITRQCCDLADFYHEKPDSARFFIRKAEETSLTHSDTLRFRYYKALFAALDKDTETYSKHRDFCLSDQFMENMVAGSTHVLAYVDAILTKAPFEAVVPLAQQVNSRPSMLYSRNLALAYNREDVAGWMGSFIIATLYRDISALNDIKTEEMSAMMHDSRLNLQIERQRTQILELWIAIVVMAVALLALSIYIATKKNKNKQ